MKVLSVGTDESIFDEKSAARARQRAYAAALGELRIVIPSLRHSSAVADGNLTIYASPPFGAFFRSFFARLHIPLIVAGVLRTYGSDVVTVQDPFETGLLALIGMMGYNIPLHVQVHTDFLSPAYAKLSFFNRIRVRIAGHVLKRAARIRVVSERIKTEIETNYRPAAAITVLPIFVDLEKMRDAQPPAELAARFQRYKTKLLFVGRLEPEKNAELALRVLVEAAPADSCMIVVGEGRMRKPLEELAHTLRVLDRVFFEGAQPAAQYYKLADLVLVPSKYEGYGLVIVEALAAGKPVLSTDVGIAREAGAIVSSEKDFAAALRQWFESGTREGALKNYSYDNFDDYVRAYRDDIAACTKAK